MDHTTPASAIPAANSPSPGVIRSRIANACDGCKARKVKCDGGQPCRFCVRRQRPHACHYTAQRRARQSRRSAASVDGSQLPRSPPRSTAGASASTRDASIVEEDSGHGVGLPARRHSKTETAEGDTDVPREARLLLDAQGKLIFIGDCAPLSLFQSVRQLVTSCVNPNAFAPEASRYSVLENAAQPPFQHSAGAGPPDTRPADIPSAVSNYITATTGIVDLFDESTLTDDVLLWANIDRKPRNLTSVINYLILAIGGQGEDSPSSHACFEYARDQAFATLSGDLGVGTVQAFTLITLYMLSSCQINSASLVFGIAARAAYSVGVHRTEVNARFGPEPRRLRDRLWKSLRVLDLFLSTSMGRPPAVSDVDCTVPYRSLDAEGNDVSDLLDSSVQIMLIVEGIVDEVYSRRKISLPLTEGLSLRLRQWSARWLQRLGDVVARPAEHGRAQVSGACQVLSSYYYAVMLVSRPFLMYELFRRLRDAQDPTTAAAPSVLTSGRAKLADACIDAASLMVDPVLNLIDQGLLNGRKPLLVSWLFASSLVLGVGLLGGFGRILEKYTRMSIRALDHFAESDAHATQYSLIAQSLLTTALAHLENRELQDRLRRTESSRQLFGLVPHDSHWEGASPRQPIARTAAEPVSGQHVSQDRSSSPPPQQQALSAESPRVAEFDSAFSALGDSLVGQDGDFWNSFQNDGESGSALNLFPLLEAGGGIDLAHYL